MRTASSITGPSPTAVVQYYAPREPDITLLHTAAELGRTLFAMHPLHTYESFAPNALDGLQHALTTQSAPLANAPTLGWITQLSYDLAYHLENIGTRSQDDLHWPLVRATLYNRYAEFDSVSGRWTLYSLTDSDDLAAWATEFAAIPNNTTSELAGHTAITPPSQSAYEAGVGRILQYIATGDIYQANLTHRWHAQTTNSPHHIYKHLTKNNPSEFAAYLQWQNDSGEKSAVISASPELFLRRNKNDLETRPMKGTRPRGKNKDQDEVLRLDLLQSEKDKAELAMIVDLLRNDLGRVSEFGTVKVSKLRTLEMHPTVWHTTATVESVLRADLRDNWAALLAALIPGGSITGAPKIRACQIIDELEPHRRGLYCGHLGILNPVSYTTALNIAIRTMLLRQNPATKSWEAFISAGAGIVSDSVPSDEYAETCAKAAALLYALQS